MRYSLVSGTSRFAKSCAVVFWCFLPPKSTGGKPAQFKKWVYLALGVGKLERFDFVDGEDAEDQLADDLTCFNRAEGSAIE